MINTPCVYLGNDLVDLRHARRIAARSGRLERLKARILSDAEWDWLTTAPSEDRIWILWAAKEVAFKVRCKIHQATPVFQPRQFTSALLLSPGETGWLDVTGEVRGEAVEVSVHGWACSEYVHLMGWNGGTVPSGAEMGVERIPDDIQLPELREHFTLREWRCIHSLPSAWVRILAKRRLAGLFGKGEEGLEIVTSEIHRGQKPPRVLVRGRETNAVDLSLSHHGRYVAWAVIPRSPEG